MSWRIVVITSRAKIDYRMGYMTVRGAETYRIFLDEVNTVIIESTAVSLTAAWISECVKRKIKIIWCDEKCNPVGEVNPYYGTVDASQRLRWQIRWTEERKQAVWALVVAEKLRQQAVVLQEFGCDEEAEKLLAYREEIQPGDSTNREGQGAKVYFNALFGRGFVRGAAEAPNGALNYGYTVLLAQCNREIAVAGYLTQLGIFHDNVYNVFNLGSDIMEPFRPLIDRHVAQMPAGDLSPEVKRSIINVMNQPVTVGGRRTLVVQAVKAGCRNVLKAMETGELEDLRHGWYEV